MTEQPNDGPDRPDVKAAWNEAGERLTGLGSRLKQHYQQHAEPAPEQTGAEVKDAAKRLNQAVHTAFEALASASKDQSVKDDARRAGRSVADALSGTFAGLSGELSRTFGGSARSEAAGSGASSSPAPAPSVTPAPNAADPDYGSPEHGSPEHSSPADSSPEHGSPQHGTPTGTPPGVSEPDAAKNDPPDDTATNLI